MRIVMMSGGKPSAWWVIVMVLLSGCAGAESGVPAGADAPDAGSDVASAEPSSACVPVAPNLRADASLAGMSGEYRLTLVADSTGGGMRSTTGTLSLRAQPEGLRTLADASTPLGGSTDVDVEAVGAHRVGDLGSRDPEAPGVLVIESDESSGRSVLLRLGSEANRRDVVRFDGAYTVLVVHHITSDGFAGRWRSGVRGPRTEGYFCAVGPEG